MFVIASWGAAIIVAAMPQAAPRPTPTPTPAVSPSPSAPVSPVENLSTTMVLLIVIAAVVGGYILSLRLHPNTKCPRCGGKGIHRGVVFSYATRACSKCGGRGIRPRLGLRVFSSKG
jgi:hypothetical protein